MRSQVSSLSRGIAEQRQLARRAAFAYGPTNITALPSAITRM